MHGPFAVPVRSGCLLLCAVAVAAAADQVKVEGGVLAGIAGADPAVRVFEGVPFAAPPVGALRWQAPQPAAAWNGVRKADQFGARCYQGSVFSDMIFRDKGISEDCLYLNVWTPSPAPKKRLPVLVYFYGGGFAAGSGDEPRYDGTNFAKKGVIVVTVNYRLGVFGFLAHPELTAESPHKASGNYGMLDQVAALQWVHRNIGAFGGDPEKVTIGGESAGSMAVSVLMASPLAAGLFRGAIGESGAMFGGVMAPLSLDSAEKIGANFATSLGAKSLAEMRAASAEDVLKASTRVRSGPIIDGYFLTADPASTYAAGKQSHVALLAGWNADEVRMGVLSRKEKPTAASFRGQLSALFGDKAAAAAEVYAASTDEEALASAGDLASDTFIVYSTWKWIEMHSATGQAPVYRFRFDRAVPLPEGTPNPAGVKGLAGHSWELEYVFGALDSKKAAWAAEDRQASEQIAAYFANFIKKANPNGGGLPKWPAFGKTRKVMHLDAASHATPEEHRDRYEFLDGFYTSAAKK
ncbi:MAG: carboxylesterase family protein [Bryobacteraceae bacterium]|jgi:para-nitrobenzyl esterase